MCVPVCCIVREVSSCSEYMARNVKRQFLKYSWQDTNEAMNKCCIVEFFFF